MQWEARVSSSFAYCYVPATIRIILRRGETHLVMGDALRLHSSCDKTTNHVKNDDHHRVAAKKFTISSAADRQLRCMVLFWLFFVLLLVLMLDCHSD